MNDLVAATLETRVWGTVATTIAGKSDRETYRKEIADWAKFIHAELGTSEGARRFVEATPVYAKMYREHLERGRGMPTREGDPERDNRPAPATLIKKLYILRGLYRDLQEEGLIDRNPFSIKQMPGLDYQKRPTLCVPFSKVWTIINMPGSEAFYKFQGMKPRKTAVSPMSEDREKRDRAWLAMFFGGALRRSEVVKIRMRDVKESDGGSTFLELRGTKNGSDAQQSIPSWAAELVWAWHARRRAKGALPNDFLFCPLYKDTGEHRAGALTPNALHKSIKVYIESAGLDPKMFSAHSARVTAVTKLLKDGLTHSQVMDFSRHGSIEMVEYYNKLDEAKEQKAAHALVFEKSAKAL